jgi:hypothetical protein
MQKMYGNAAESLNIRELSIEEIEMVSGGGFWDHVARGLVTWTVSKALDSAVSYIARYPYDADADNGSPGYAYGA